MNSNRSKNIHSQISQIPTMNSRGAGVQLFPSDVAVLMVPFPIQGHLNQLLHLSRVIAGHSIPVHFAATAAHNRQALNRIHGWNPLSVANIVFHHLPSLHFQSARPVSNSSIYFPSHLQPLFDASAALRRPVADLIQRLSSEKRRVVIIYDSLMGFVIQDFVNFTNAEAYTFHSVSAYTIFFFLWENLGKPFQLDPEVMEDVPSLDGCFTPEFVEFIRNQHGYLGFYSGRIYNTSPVLERKFLDLLARPEINGSKKQWALGPFNPVSNPSGDGGKNRHECLKWLDGQAMNSVILVSFGTTTTLPENQIYELAMGLENSHQKFVWVVRGADCGSDDVVNDVTNGISLPLGFEERVGGRGMIVRDWAPQLAILGHTAIGGFMSHCGWNSSMESISMGVPIAAWPMHSDQPRNAVLIVKVLKIGVVVRDWTRRESLVEATVVESAVRLLMASEEGEGMRKTAAELGSSLRKTAAAEMELESFISCITR